MPFQCTHVILAIKSQSTSTRLDRNLVIKTIIIIKIKIIILKIIILSLLKIMTIIIILKKIK